MKTSEFAIQAEGRSITCTLAEPDVLSTHPQGPALLMTFTLTRQMSIFEDVYNLPTQAFLAAGHRVLSFDLPHHGDRIGPWKTRDIHGFCEAFVAGVDPFAQFVADGRAAVDAVVSRGLAREGRIVLAGLSRGGYCALRLAASEPRIAATAALAPVTDWRALSEFAAVKDRADVAGLALEHVADRLAGGAIYLAIGSADRRVGTERCAAFVARLFEAEAAAGLKSSRLRVHFLHDSDNHRLADAWRSAGAEFLLEVLR